MSLSRGVAKTRLAIEAVAASPALDAGVWFIDLAPLPHDAAIDATVAALLSIQASSGTTVREAIIAAISGRQMLLIFDNCEHVVEGAADLIAAIIEGTRVVQVLATSREPLGVAGEQVHPVVPRSPQAEAVTLFVERVRARNPR